MQQSINNIGGMATPNDFILHYYNELKNKTEKTDILLSRNGFLGFFLEVLGNQQFDTKYYYDFLFKEAFPITATQNKNLVYHANLYNFIPQLSTPSILVGQLKFNLDYLPFPSSNMVYREVIFDQPVLKVGGMDYILSFPYSILITKIGNNNYNYIVNIETNRGNIKKEITNEDQYVPIQGIIQKYTDSISFTIGVYPFGSYFQKVISNNGKFLSSLEILVNPFGEKTWTTFKTYQNKDYVDQYSEVVFFTILPNNDIMLEFGSGEKGKYVSNCNIVVNITTTDGEKGNIIYQNSNSFTGRVGIFDYDDQRRLLYSGGQYLPIKNFVTAEIDEGVGGKNPLVGDNLRNALIQYIQTRENLVSELDFRNIIGNYYSDYEMLFKKTDLVLNTFFIYIGLKKKYYDTIPIYSNTVSIPISDFEADTRISSKGEKYIFEPKIQIAGKQFVSPFLYKFNNVLKVYDGYNVLYKPYFYSYSIVNSDITIIPPIVYICLEFMVTYTRIYARSYNSFGDYEVYISSSGLFLSNAKMVKENDTNWYIDIYDEMIDKEYVEIFLVLPKTGYKIVYKFDNIYQLIPISNILRLKPYKKLDGQYYILNLEVIDDELYQKDVLYYNNKFISDLFGIVLEQNRMISDEIGLRFLNNYWVAGKLLSMISIQKYNFDLLLPFQIKIDMILDRTKINNVDIDILNLKIFLSQWLIDNQTGTKISFYKSHIHQLIHDYAPWVKSCYLTLFDNTGFEIPNSNFESYPIKTLIDTLPKEDVLDFTPIYYWFDVDNIGIDYSFTS